MITNTLARPVVLLIALGVSLSAHATLRSWLGTDMFNPTRWTVANNWLSGAPVAGDDLVFPAGASHPNNNNDFPVSTTFNSIAIGGNNYTLGGNSIALNAGILVTNSGNMVTVNNSLRLNSNQTFTVNASSSGLSLLGPIDTNGKDLTVAVTSPAVMQVSLEISGAGGLIKTGSGSLIVSNNSYAGTTIISNGTMRVLGSQPGSPVTLYGGTLGGNGTVGTLTASGPGAKILDPGTSPGILTSSNVLLDANTTLAIQLNGPTPGPGYDQLNVAGSVNLGGASLGLSLGFIPTAVNTFIIVNNDGSDPVVGTFSGLPEGTTFTNSGVPFRIAYAGGDGNDVVLNLAGVPRTWSGAGVNSLWTNPANWDGGVAPSAGDDLIFPASPIQIGGLNNYPSGTVFNSITIAGGFYQLSGSNIFLRGGINASNTAFQNSIDLPLTLLADQSITSGNANVNLYLTEPLTQTART